MFGLRQKLLLGFLGLLAIMTVISIQSTIMLSELGETMNNLLRGDYRSVVACQNMKESLQLIDSGIEFSLLEKTGKSQDLIKENVVRFKAALAEELNNINLPGESEKTEKLRELFDKYEHKFPEVFNVALSNEERKAIYLRDVHPLFEASISTANDILQMNQENMDIAGQEVKETAANTVSRMYAMLGAGTALAIIFLIFIRRWILLPLQTLTESVRQIEHGNLDLAIAIKSHDELAEFARAFNAMAARLRDVRQGDQARLVRTQRTTQMAVDSLPDAVAVLSPEGKVEMVNDTAIVLFGLKPGDDANREHKPWLPELWQSCLQGPPGIRKGYESAIQIFDDGEEKFFIPQAIPIRDERNRLAGITIVLADITHLRKLDELKSSLLATASHELKTPLTSLQMAIHLLQGERNESLTVNQVELLNAARADVDRLCVLVANILDYSRIEAGRVQMDLQNMKTADLIASATEPLRAAFQTQDVQLVIRVPEGISDVRADPARIGLVFSNLLSNSLKYTPKGGTVTISAHAVPGENAIAFKVTDTGPGIPETYRERIFEKYFRVPGQKTAGAGLGLAIAREIVQAHGGTISCNSSTDSGSEFTFTLTQAEKSAEPALIAEKPTERTF